MATLQVSYNDPNLNFSNWSKVFADVLNKHAPVKSKRVKHEIQPEWLNEENKFASKTRDAYHKHKNWGQYKIWRNKTTALILKAKKELFSKSTVENKINSFLWKHIKNLKGKPGQGYLLQTIKVITFNLIRPLI